MWMHDCGRGKIHERGPISATPSDADTDRPDGSSLLQFEPFKVHVVGAGQPTREGSRSARLKTAVFVNDL
jgi:hypothetical protein